MKKTVLIISLALLVLSCESKIASTKKQDLNEKFNQYKAYFVDELWKINPEWAASQGFHHYDSILLLPSVENEKIQLQFTANQMDSIKNYPLDQLSDHNQTDVRMMENLLKNVQFSINELKSRTWNPSQLPKY